MDNNIECEIFNCCPLCDSKQTERWINDAEDLLHGLTSQQFQYSKCKACGLAYCSKRPTESSINEIYPNDYDPYTGEKTLSSSGVSERPSFFYRKFNKLFISLFGSKASHQVKNIYTSSSGTLLDFGCGSARFLNQAREWGWQTIGVDFNEQATDDVVASGHEAYLFNQGSDLNEIPDRSVDLIRLNHVLEHLYNPVVTLKLLLSKLKPGGTLHIAVPNPAGHSARKFGKFWRGLECPRHVMLYPPSTLKYIVENKLNMNLLGLYHEDICKDYIRSRAYYLCANSKDESSDIESLVHDDALIARYTILGILSALFKRGDRIHAIAQKPF